MFALDVASQATKFMSVLLEICNQPPRPQCQGRAFTMDAEEAKKSEDLIQGVCEVNGKTLTVLYDLGASHFFISHSCVTALQLPISAIPYDLLVSTPTNKPIKTIRSV